MSQVLIIDETRLESILDSVIDRRLRAVLAEGRTAISSQKLYSINAVAKRLGKAHSTIKKYALEGRIAIASNGQISEEAINKFLSQEKNT